MGAPAGEGESEDEREGDYEGEREDEREGDYEGEREREGDYEREREGDYEGEREREGDYEGEREREGDYEGEREGGRIGWCDMAKSSPFAYSCFSLEARSKARYSSGVIFKCRAGPPIFRA